MLSHALGAFLGGLVAHYLFSPLGLLILVGVFVAAMFMLFPAFAVKWFTDARVWLAIVCICGVAYIVNLRTDVADLKTQNAAITQVQNVQAGTLKTLNDLVTAKAKNATQTTRLHSVAAAAPEGKKQDAVLDQIASDDAGLPAGSQPAPVPAPGIVAHGSQLDRLFDQLDPAHGGPAHPAGAH